MNYLFVLIGLAVEAIVLFYTAKFFSVKNNNAQKAIAVVLASFFAGNLIGPFLVSVFFSPFVAVLLPFIPLILVVVLLLRLIIIKIVYGTGIGTAFGIWIVSAIASIGLSFFLPFY